MATVARLLLSSGFFALFSIFTDTASAAKYECEKNWDILHDTCYSGVNTPKTWEDAEKHCVENGGHLAAIHDPVQMAFVTDVGHELKSDVYGRVWIGANDKEEEGKLVYTDGSDFDHYIPSTTDESPGKFEVNSKTQKPKDVADGEDCVLLRVRELPGMRDNFCSSLIPYVCMKKAKKVA